MHASNCVISIQLLMSEIQLNGPLIPYEYVSILDGKTAADLDGAFPICQFISQAVECASPSDVTKRLLMAQRAKSGIDLLVYVVDSEQFILRESVGTKTLVDEYVLKRTISYERPFARYYEFLAACRAVMMGSRRNAS